MFIPVCWNYGLKLRESIVIKQLLMSASLFASLMASAEAQPDRPGQPREGRVPAQQQACQSPDLIIPDLMAVTGMTLDTVSSEVTMLFIATTDNIGACDARPSRTKAILTLAGGRWLGQDKFDIPVLVSGDYTNVEFEITLPYEGLLDEECTLSRDDFVLTVSADWRESNAETDEANNAHAFNFATSTDSLCTSSSDYHLDTHAPFRNPFERPLRLNDRYRH